MTDPSPQEVEILAEASRLLTSTLDLTEVLDRLAEIAHRRLETDVARIWLLDDAGEVLRLTAHKGRVRSPLPAREHVATRSSLVGWSHLATSVSTGLPSLYEILSSRNTPAPFTGLLSSVWAEKSARITSPAT